MSIQKSPTNGIGLTTIFQSVERNEELFSSRCRHAYSTWTKVSTISSRGSSLTPVHKKLDKNLNRRVVRLNIFPLSRLPRVTLVVFAELLNIFLLSLCVINRTSNLRNLTSPFCRIFSGSCLNFRCSCKTYKTYPLSIC